MTASALVAFTVSPTEMDKVFGENWLPETIDSACVAAAAVGDGRGEGVEVGRGVGDRDACGDAEGDAVGDALCAGATLGAAGLGAPLAVRVVAGLADLPTSAVAGTDAAALATVEVTPDGVTVLGTDEGSEAGARTACPDPDEQADVATSTAIDSRERARITE